MTETVGRIGEWRLLARLLPRISRRLSRRVVLGPGDDAAVVRAEGALAVTTDMLVEDVHFRLAWTTGEDLGHKTLAVSLSDLAAMGDAGPGFGVLSAGLPPKTPVPFLDGFYRGFARLARRHGFELVGGDTVRADKLVFSLAAWAPLRGQALRRRGARPGDVLMVTGSLGDAAAGLAVLERRRRRGAGERELSPHERFLVRRFRRPEPRMRQGARLARSRSVTAALDVSDGLWRSARLLAEASGVGLRIDADRLPMSPALRAWAGRAARGYALAGGEDYEILFTAGPEAAERLARDGTAAEIGRATPRGQGTTVWENGKPRGVPSGFEHFDER